MPGQLHLVGMPEKQPAKEGFDEFWDSWPKKDAKFDARKAWKQLRIDESAELRAEVFSGLRRAITYWRERGVERQFIPHPASWLRGHRWADEYPSEDDELKTLLE